MLGKEEEPQPELTKEMLMTEYQQVLAKIGHEADCSIHENQHRLRERLLNIEKYVYDLLERG